MGVMTGTEIALERMKKVGGASMWFISLVNIIIYRPGVARAVL